MSQIVDEVLAANKKYASNFGAKKDLALPPARGFAILTCMDARLDPRNTPAYLKVTPTSFEMPVDAPATMPFGRS